MPFIYVFISTGYSLPHPTPEGSWWFLNHYQWVPMKKNNGDSENKRKLFPSPPPPKWLKFKVKPKLGGCAQLGNLLTNTVRKLDVMKHIHFKSQVSARGGICQITRSSSSLLKTVSAFNYFQQFCSLSVNCIFHCFLAWSKHYLPSTVRLRSFWSCARVWVGRDTLVLSCEWWSLLALSRNPLLSCTLHIPWKQHSNGL